MGIYLIGNLSLPLLEGIHFLLHLGDDTTSHSFQSHTEVHAHKTLTFIGQFIISEDTGDNQNKKPFIVKIKKTFQYFQSIITSYIEFQATTSAEFDYLMNNSTPFLSYNAPPPKFLHSV